VTENTVESRGQAYRVETQTPAISNEAIADAQKLIGVDYRAARDTFEITRDWIRQYCNYIDSRNPLYLDEDYARKTSWGGIIAPPMMIFHTPNIAPGLRGVHWLWGGQDLEWYQPIRLGDVLTQRGRLVAMEEKTGKMVQRMLLQTGEIVFYNQRGELVAKAYTYMMRAPRQKSGAGFHYEPRRQKYSDDDLKRIEEQMATYQIRGSFPRYWEEVAVGEEIGPAVYGPYRIGDIAFNLPAEGSASGGAHYYELKHRRRHPADAYIDPETGIEDHPHRGHWEEFMAQEVGMPGIYDWAMQRIQAMSDRLLFDWIGDDGVLKRAGGRIRRPVVVDDTIYLKARVTKKYIQRGEHLVEFYGWEENQLGDVVMEGQAAAALPSKG
jgi:acyl dehydratase